MITLIYGLDIFLKNEEIKNIVSNYNKTDILKYDLEINNINEVLEDASLNSLFSEKKLIVVSNSIIFTGKKCDIDHNLDNLLAYLNNPNPSVHIVFVVETEKLDERKKITRLLKSKYKVIEVNSIKNYNIYIKEVLNDYIIDDNSVNLFIERVGKNLAIINLEIEKLKCYKGEDNIITREDILEVSSKNLYPDLFTFIDSLVKKDLKKSFEIYQNLLLLNEEPIKIIIMIANQFRLIYQVKNFIKYGYDIDYISKELDTHPYPVKLAVEKGRLYSDDTLLSYIKKLAELDFEIKSGKKDKYMGLEMFILNV